MSLDSAHAPRLPGGAGAPEHGAPPEDDGGPGGVLTAGAVTALGPVSFGYVIGFSSPAAAPLLASGLLTAAQLSVFEALSPLGAIAGAAGAGVAADTVGRTRALALCCVPFAAGWLLIALAEVRQRCSHLLRSALRLRSHSPRVALRRAPHTLAPGVET